MTKRRVTFTTACLVCFLLISPPTATQQRGQVMAKGWSNRRRDVLLLKLLSRTLIIKRREKKDEVGGKKCETFQKCEGAACFVDTTGDWVNLTPGTENIPLQRSASLCPSDLTDRLVYYPQRKKSYLKVLSKWKKWFGPRKHWRAEITLSVCRQERKEQWELRIFGMWRDGKDYEEIFHFDGSLLANLSGMNVFTSGLNNPLQPFTSSPPHSTPPIFYLSSTSG